MTNWPHPLFFHPSTIMLLDDSNTFLQGVRLDTNPHNFAIKSFDNPHLGLDFLLKRQNTLEGDPFYAQDADSGSVQPQLPDFASIVTSPKRFDILSVLVVDYVMPGLNGLEVCRSVKDKPFKKILLTGTADESLAVKAFNEGLIDKFIHKDSRNFNYIFNQTLQQLSHAFFKERLRMVQSLLLNNDLRHSALSVPAFTSFFDSLLVEESIKEYYLADLMGSHFFMTFDGKPSFLRVMTRATLEHYRTIAEQAGVDQATTRKMAQGAYIPFAMQPDALNHPDLWKKQGASLLHPCETMGPDFLIAYIEAGPNFTNKLNKLPDSLVSFKQYLKNQ